MPTPTDPELGTHRGRWTLRSTQDVDPRPPGDLQTRYEWYRARQVSMLLTMLPPGGVRSLYAHARGWAAERAEHEGKDPLATLRRFVESLLPMPPFEVWAEDYRANRIAYLDDDLDPPVADVRNEPVTVELRAFRARDRAWTAALKLFNDGAVWRGFLSFDAGVGPVFSTAEIFCEPTAQDIRERFLSFESDTLRAFLRSALP